MIQNAITAWPGKSPPEGSDLPEHPAVYDMRDVAAVAERLIDSFRYDKLLRDAMILPVALHDPGKIRVRTHIQQMTGAAREPAGRKAFGHLPYPVVPHRQSPQSAEHDSAPVAFFCIGACRI